MDNAPVPRPQALTVERIVDAASALVERDGLVGLSMRKLGAQLGVDPMAVYHHVASKRELLALVTARTLGTMPPPDPTAPWADQVRQWTTRYWDLVVAHRDLTLAGLADPAIGAGGMPSTEPLVAAVAASGVPDRPRGPIAYLIVDAVHGSALAAGTTSRQDGRDPTSLRIAFAAGLDTIVAGIAARAQP